MTKNEFVKAILSTNPNATLVRVNKANYIAVPAEVVDGVQTYLKIGVGTFLYKDTATHPAFDFETAKQAYTEWKATADERADRPKVANEDKVAAKAAAEARRNALDKAVANLPVFEDYTATDIYNALDTSALDKVTVMSVGSACMRLVDAGILAVTVDEKKKKHYSKA